MIRRPPRSTLFPYRRSSDLWQFLWWSWLWSPQEALCNAINVQHLLTPCVGTHFSMKTMELKLPKQMTFWRNVPLTETITPCAEKPIKMCVEMNASSGAVPLKNTEIKRMSATRLFWRSTTPMSAPVKVMAAMAQALLESPCFPSSWQPFWPPCSNKFLSLWSPYCTTKQKHFQASRKRSQPIYLVETTTINNALSWK